MTPFAARASVIMLSFAVLALSAVFTSLVWSLLSPLEMLPRGVLSLLVWVTVYYLGANAIFWKAVVRMSAAPLPRQN